MPIVLNGSGPITGVTSLNTTVSDTEIGYLDGVTSALQTQINTAGGLVKITDSSFSAAASVSVNNCFTSTYTNYLIVVEQLSSAGTTGRLRFRASGSDNTTSNYFNCAIGRDTGGTTVTQENSTASSMAVTFFGDFKNVWQIVVSNPQVAARTIVSSTCLAANSTASNQLAAWIHGGQFSQTTQFDGFTWYGDSGTITGTLRVYGYRN